MHIGNTEYKAIGGIMYSVETNGHDKRLMSLHK